MVGLCNSASPAITTVSDSIRIALFDAVGTVLFPDPGVTQVYQRLGAKHNSSLGFVELKERITAARVSFFQVGQPDPDVDLRSSDEIEFGLWKQLVREVFSELPSVDELFGELWQHFARPENWQVYDDVLSCWDTLRTNNVKIGLVSNFDSRLIEICKTLPPFDSADFVFCSAQVGFRKPSPDFYYQVEHQIRAELNLPQRTPIQIVMVGDDLQNDFVAPKKFGWSSVWLNRRACKSTGAYGDLASLREINSLDQFVEFFNSATDQSK